MTDLCRLAGIAPVIAPEFATLGHALTTTRPRLVVLSSPPAGPRELDLVAAERRRRPSMRAMFVNHPSDVDERLRALALGFDDAVPNTTPVEELLGRARLLAAQPARSSGLRVVADGVVLDTVAHEVRRDGVVVHFRPKEFSLLALLASHPGRVFTRRQLLDRVWGAGVDSHPRTVDVHVRWLRSKIEPDPERPIHLITVRGIGYRLDPAPALTTA